MTNTEIAATFRLLADLLAIRGESPFKIAAYRRAAEGIEALTESVAALRQRGRLSTIPGVGTEIAQKIGDLIDTGTIPLLERVRQEYPPSVATLLTVPDVGPKRARLLYRELGIDSRESLRAAIAAGRLTGVAGIGPRTIERIATGLATTTADERRLPIAVARSMGLDLIAQLRARAPALRQVELVGSIRRVLETIGDLDIVAAADDPEPVIAAFVALPDVAHVESRGENRCRVMLRNDFGADVWVLPERYWGSLLQHATGSKYHNIHLRDIALERGLRMSEYGFTRSDAHTTCETEEEVYAFMGMSIMPPPMREDTGEIERALADTLPAVIAQGDLRGDLHVHSTWSDGKASIREMAVAALARGYDYLCITDHSHGLAIAHGLTAERLRAQRDDIATLNAELAPFRVLHGVEVEVRADGSLDLPVDALAELDLVVAAIHTGLRQQREQLMRRAFAALRHPLVDILAHPTGRLIGERAGADLDMEALSAEAARTGTALEINGDPKRMDLRDIHARTALDAGCVFTVDSDAHDVAGLDQTLYGIGVAQRAWIPPARVLNTLPLPDFLARRKRGR